MNLMKEHNRNHPSHTPVGKDDFQSAQHVPAACAI
jgi:hypothetical protein